MDYTKLGSTGLDVSPLCFGAMSFGEPDRGDQKWTLGEDDSRALFRQAHEAGINFFDTANQYSGGSSEEILGRAVRDFADRDEVVIATKVYFPQRPGPNGSGLSRKAILTEIDHSLRRLGMDHVDLYQIHRWDDTTPIDETMEALHDVVKAGKARYLGASTMYAWQFAKAQHVAERHGWTRFATMQNHYNLLYREEEREMIPLCADQGVGLIPWSPMARGRLTREWDATTARAGKDGRIDALYRDTDKTIVDEVGAIAGERGVSRAQIALAWVSANPQVSAPIIGATKPHHVSDAVASLDVTLTDDERTRLEAGYRTREWQS